jgi:hypothetical protein
MFRTVTNNVANNHSCWSLSLLSCQYVSHSVEPFRSVRCHAVITQGAPTGIMQIGRAACAMSDDLIDQVSPGQASKLAVLLDALDGVVISDGERASLARGWPDSRRPPCTLSCRGILRIGSPGSASDSPVLILLKPNGFPVSTSSATIRCARPRPRRQPEFGDSRRAPALRETHADSRIVAIV